MKSFKFAIIGLASICALALSAPVQAQPSEDSVDVTSSGSCSKDTRFLLFPAWYNGLVQADGEDCNIVSPNSEEIGGIDKFIWRIALNIVEILLVAAGYLAVGFIIYGGYKYMISAGSPDGMVSARKTIMNACIGLVISIAAVAIVNTVSGGLGVGR